jgi:hypothetical protein
LRFVWLAEPVVIRLPASGGRSCKEIIDDIRQFFAKDCVDFTCAGDLEEVEIELGFRSERSTPKPDFAQLYGRDALHVPEKPQSDDILALAAAARNTSAAVYTETAKHHSGCILNGRKNLTGKAISTDS